MKHDIKEKQKSWLRNLFHPKASPVKEEKDILKLIERETIPSVRAAWIDYFLEKTKTF